MGSDSAAVAERERTPRKILFVVPHFYEFDERTDPSSAVLSTAGNSSRLDSRELRSAAVIRSVSSFHETFGPALSVAPGVRLVVTPMNTVDVILVTTRGKHLVDELGVIGALFDQVEVDVEPVELGFAVHRVLAEHAGQYDYYCYLEDDAIIRDALFFDKLSWFSTTFGADVLLQPNRFEISGGHKVYPDGPQPPEATQRMRQPDGPDELRDRWFGRAVRFEHPSNPHAAGFFVNSDQFDRVRAWPGFGKPSAEFIGPLETAGTLAVSSVFRVYKPARPSADLLEVQHQGARYLTEWGLPEPAHVAAAARLGDEARLDDVGAELAALRASTSWRVTAPLRAVGRVVRRLARR